MMALDVSKLDACVAKMDALESRVDAVVARRDSLHKEYGKVKDHAAVKEAVRKFREEAKKNGFGPGLKPLEAEINRQVEKALSPKS